MRPRSTAIPQPMRAIALAEQLVRDGMLPSPEEARQRHWKQRRRRAREALQAPERRSSAARCAFWNIVDAGAAHEDAENRRAGSNGVVSSARALATEDPSTVVEQGVRIIKFTQMFENYEAVTSPISPRPTTRGLTLLRKLRI